MKPYYDHGGITIYHGDCRGVIGSIPLAGLVMTDPPYGIGEAAGKNKSRSKLAAARDYGNSGWDNAPVPDRLMADIVSAGERACVFGGNYYSLGPASCWLVWDKENGSNDFADAELAWTNYGTAVRLIRHRWNGMLRKGREQRHHPTQKPLHVITWAIERCPGSPELILDPFMGSGTTLRAAKDLGRRAIGVELEEKYCEAAALRLSQEVLITE